MNASVSTIDQDDIRVVPQSVEHDLRAIFGHIEGLRRSGVREAGQVATLAYGLGNWYLVRGDKAQARKWFERSVQSGGWPGFGFIVSEVELRRLR